MYRGAEPAREGRGDRPARANAGEAIDRVRPRRSERVVQPSEEGRPDPGRPGSRQCVVGLPVSMAAAAARPAGEAAVRAATSVVGNMLIVLSITDDDLV